jgi:hypothetical protein
MNIGLGINWYMGWMVWNVGCRRNAKGYWALWMILNIGFRRMSMDFGLWA